MHGVYAARCPMLRVPKKCIMLHCWVNNTFVDKNQEANDQTPATTRKQKKNDQKNFEYKVVDLISQIFKEI